MKILFFIESLRSGGKERRLVELLHHLRGNTNFDLYIVITEPDIHYKEIFELNIPVIVIERKYFKKDITLFFRFLFLVLKIRPDIISTWGGMNTIYALPTTVLMRITLINCQIADSSPRNKLSLFEKVIWFLNHHFSKKVIANSYAGLNVYKVNKNKGVVIHNGVRLERFDLDFDYKLLESGLGIKTKYKVVMVASFTAKKNYSLFVEIAYKVCKARNDVTFVAVGDGETKNFMRFKVIESGLMDKFLFTGQIRNVEEVIKICDIGVLFSPHEGIPNSIIEYMALRKPVIASHVGGISELVFDGVSGFLVNNNVADDIVSKINLLLDDETLRHKMGETGRRIIESDFSIKKMGELFISEFSNYSNT